MRSEMAAVQQAPSQQGRHLRSPPERTMEASKALDIPAAPGAKSLPYDSATSQTMRTPMLNIGTFSPVNENGSFEFDRVLKSGYVQKRTRKIKGWRSIFLVLRPQSLSLYKNENESQLRHKVQLSDLTAVALLKDPKHKRHNVFGLFSPSRNYHLEAATLKDAQEWVDMIRREARIEEEEEELYLASPGGTTSRSCLDFHKANGGKSDAAQMAEERIGSSSPEPLHLTQPMGAGRPSDQRRPSQTMDYSGNDMSDMSDNDLTRAAGIFSTSIPNDTVPARPKIDPATANMSDLERVIWQGHLLYLKSSAGVRQWKNLWVVARQRNIALYKNDAEYTLLKIIPIDSIINVVEVDPLSKTKKHCLQIITEERSYKFCAHNETEWDQSLGAFKSLLARRKGETRTQS